MNEFPIYVGAEMTRLKAKENQRRLTSSPTITEVPPLKKITSLLVALAVSVGGACAFAADTPVSTNAPAATTYQIRNVKHRELLRPKDANSASGTPIVLYPAQPWKCMTWRLHSAGESGFHLKNLFTGKTFCATSDLNAPQQFVTQAPLAKAGGESPTWQFTPLEDGSYKITDSKSGQALTAIKSSKGDSIRIVVSPWQEQEEQKWLLEKMDPKQLTM